LLVSCVLITAAAYAADYLFLRLRMTSSFAGDAFGSVTTYTATTTKSGKLQIFYEHPETEICAHSLFPHLGRKPCWYVIRSPINLVSQSFDQPRTGDTRQLAWESAVSLDFPSDPLNNP
jgi:hypothetical protein